MEETLQHQETAQCFGLPPASPGNHRSDGNQAGHALTFKPDHLVGADQDDRVPSADGKLPPVGNTVDVKNASWTNTIGSSELITVWEDPDFDPAEGAFYYTRVIEIPTPRWTAYDVKYYGITDVSPNIPMTTQERAYTSPIWYTPKN